MKFWLIVTSYVVRVFFLCTSLWAHPWLYMESKEGTLPQESEGMWINLRLLCATEILIFPVVILSFCGASYLCCAFNVRFVVLEELWTLQRTVGRVPRVQLVQLLEMLSLPMLQTEEVLKALYRLTSLKNLLGLGWQHIYL